MQPRKCPNCGETIENDANYSFDDDLNLICSRCGKIAFPTSWKSNNEIDIAVRERKGGWGGNKMNSQATFPATGIPGIPGLEHNGLPSGRPQVPGNQTENRFCQPTTAGRDIFPHDDVDDYQEMPFYTA